MSGISLAIRSTLAMNPHPRPTSRITALARWSRGCDLLQPVAAVLLADVVYHLPRPALQKSIRDRDAVRSGFGKLEQR